MKNYKLLVVDDAFFVRNLIKKAVSNKPSNKNFSISVIGESKNAKEALDFCETENPDIITVDYQMPPGINGLELIKELKLKYTNTMIIMISDDETIKNKVLNLNCHFITKPFKEQVLWSEIDNIILENAKKQIKSENQNNKIEKNIEISTNNSNSKKIKQPEESIDKESIKINTNNESVKKKKKKKKKKNLTSDELNFGFKVAGSLNQNTDKNKTDNNISDNDVDIIKTINKNKIQEKEENKNIDEFETTSNDSNFENTNDDLIEKTVEIVDELSLDMQNDNNKIEETSQNDDIIIIDEKDETKKDETKDDTYYIDDEDDVFTFYEEDESEYEDKDIDKFKEDSIQTKNIVNETEELTEDEELAALIKEASYSIDESTKIIPEKSSKSSLDLLSEDDSDIVIPITDTEPTKQSETKMEEDFDSMLDEFEKSDIFKESQLKLQEEDEFENSLDNLDTVSFTLDDLDDTEMDLNTSSISENIHKNILEENSEHMNLNKNDELDINQEKEFDSDEFDINNDKESDYLDDLEDEEFDLEDEDNYYLDEDYLDEDSMEDISDYDENSEDYETISSNDTEMNDDEYFDLNNDDSADFNNNLYDSNYNKKEDIDDIEDELNEESVVSNSKEDDYEQYFDIEDDTIPIYNTEELPVSEIIKRSKQFYQDDEILPPSQKNKKGIKPKQSRPDGTNIKQKESFFGRFFKHKK